MNSAVTEHANILIVDDNANNLLAMEASLERLGEDMVRAYSGKEALRLASEQEFAVILLDVQMPVMDGLETAEALRRMLGDMTPPIIFVTAGELTEDLVYRAYSEGAVDFLFKPYAPEIVRSKVQVFVDLFKNSRRLRTNVEELARAEEEVRELNQDLEQRVKDRTEALEKALQKAETNEHRYRQLMEALPQIVWMTDDEGNTNYCNNRFYEFTGIPHDENLHFQWEVAVHPEDYRNLQSRWKEAWASGNPLEIEFRIRRACDQTWRYHLARAEALLRPDGTVERWLGIATDIEDKIQAEATLKAANIVLADARDRAVEASHAKSLFLANMSHELRTPLNAILGYAEMMEEELNSSNIDLKEDAERIITAGRHLLSLIDDVLDMAKIEAGKMKLSLDSVQLSELVDEVATSVRGLAKQRNNSLQVTVQNGLQPVWVDPVKVRQILINLLSNACKFTENGSIDISCWAFEREGREWFSIAVKDTGIGIPENELDLLFKEFSQADPSPSRNYGGTGLGLALCQRFAHMMGGAITLESEHGTGSTFTVTLPVNVSPDVPV